MKKKIIAFILLTVMLGSLLSGCDLIDMFAADSASDEEADVQGAAFLPEDEWMVSVANRTVDVLPGVEPKNVLEWNEKYTIWAAYPAVEGMDGISLEIENYAMEKITRYKEEVLGSGLSEDDLESKPEFTLVYKPYAHGDDLLSFKFTTYADSGVTRTVNYIETFVYKTATGERASLTDIFDPESDYLNVVSAKVQEKLKNNSVLREYYDEELFNAGTAPVADNFSNFVVGENLIIFFFNQHSVAPSVAGNFEAALSFDELSGVLNPDFVSGGPGQDESESAPPESPAAASPDELPVFLQSGEEDMPAFSIEGIDPINDKVVALTFDDGPHASNTEYLLDALKEYNVKATFFMVGQNAELYPDVVQRVYSEGHEIGNHSYDHTDFYKLSTEQVVNDEVGKTNDIIQNITGVRPIIVRAPFGNIDEELVNAIGRYSIYWSVDSEDWKLKDEDLDYQAVMNVVQDGDIVLMHDIHEPSVKAARRIIESLLDQGYKLVTVTQMMQIAEARGQELGYRFFGANSAY